MKEKRMELNQDNLSNVIGGAKFQNYPTNKCGVDADHMIYTFSDQQACTNYLQARIEKYKAMDVSVVDQAVIDDLLAAGLIWPIE